MIYRREIDGLRAVAVLPVIAFHAGFGIFGGGFVGVDVFFVISGYLMATIIVSEIGADKFTIRNFYERRARRILPALFFVMLALLPFVWQWMTPRQLEDFSWSVLAVSLFSSNVLFWMKLDYFSPAAELMPLLHTWSLAVEEQYYLFFPLLILLLWRFGKRSLFATLAVLGLLSVAAAQWGSLHEPGASFFLLPMRLWELLLGSLIAVYLLERGQAHDGVAIAAKLPRELLATSGLLMIVYSIIAFDEQTPFPSFYALVPTLGTGLIILFASPETLTGRVLGTRPLVGVGLVSYSAYLWHQPLFALARLRSLLRPSDELMILLGLLSLILAYLTWRYVEQPFRDKTRFSQKQIFSWGASFTVLVAAIGIAGVVFNGFDGRHTRDGSRMADLNLDYRLRPNRGLAATWSACEVVERAEQCSTGESPEILVWGDSFAMHLVPAILASNPDVRLVMIARPECGPIVGLAPTNREYPETWADDCLKFNNSVIDWLGNHKSVRFVVLAARFRKYLSGDWLHNTDAGIAVPDQGVVLQYLMTTMNTLKDMGIKPIVIASPPSNGEDIGGCLATATIFSEDPSQCDIAVSDYEARKAEVIELLNQVGEKHRVIWVSDVLCDPANCSAQVDGIFIYGHDNHYSYEGAEFLGKELDLYSAITSR